MLKFKVGDKVKIISGKDKGRDGVIEKIFPKKGTALVPGVNMYKKHIKKALAKDNKGGIYEIPRPIDVSKLVIIDPKTKKPTRVGFKIQGGKKLRFAKKGGHLLDIKEK
ncbi:MAG: ribosomal protein L24 [Candidatus Woesebacteria bacterium GW2011_GWB1_43_14]|uniref:Large ribosomal subunit protein uL24 n=1 Tax=Candidatus Woesebacteria bacterium GW2011_GWB1_43_14 TaxID=1618578 RepID=A0A0G1GEV0_9BACT|nr:MAG: ribosomal protein L24 [Candidatus Woesebacteria bacterium GW2011_GWA1_39_11b]KKS78027.1 MAG: ribosomal protein L24 [Candidatus Woesebacteria bacterium GW2011_GWC1_42_9]KKS97393.1 MAG: ribosomal protein L24 [Candidatus Woesebacteria bacterium GW2011_GWB1_43_14]